MKRENFYTLLGLQVEPPEKDKDTIERAIVEKREQWFDILWNAPHSKAQKVRVYLDMLPEIKRIMRDENTRREEARQAKDMNRKKEMERFKQLDEIINIIGLDGTISPEESDFVICKAVAMGLKPEDTETYLKTYCFKKDWKYHPEKSLHSQERKNRNTGTGRKKKFFNNSWALVVGINNYEQKKIPNLRYAENDARAMANALPALGFPRENTRLLLSGDTAVTRDAINDILEIQFSPKMIKGDRFLFYFAGHGVSYKTGSRTAGYMLMEDSILTGKLPGKKEPYLQKSPGRSIEMESFLSKIELLPVKHKLLLMDSCFSGFMTASRDVAGTGNGAAMLNQWSGEPVTQIITAGRSGQKAYEEEADQHGVFTRYLLKGLEGHAAPREDGIISFMDLAAYIRSRVAGERRVKQDPQASIYSGEGQFFFEMPGQKPMGRKTWQ